MCLRFRCVWCDIKQRSLRCTQQHDHRATKPKRDMDLMPQQKHEALAYLIFLKHKCCRKIKGYSCADGHKQCAYTTKSDAHSPMVSTETGFLTTVIDTMERRTMAVVDMPGGLMQADIDKLVHIHLTGEMMCLLLEINHKMY